MKIMVLTYDHPHRKTQDLLLRMKAQGHNDLIVFGAEWREMKSFKPILQHRPSVVLNVSPEIFCRNLGYIYITGHLESAEKLNPEMVIIAGAGILPEGFVTRLICVNSHPGYLPYCRGLDALKWALWENIPLGVTLHRVSAEADAGYLIKQEITPIVFGDTFHSIAWRHYEKEIELLAAAPELFTGAEKKIDVTGQPVRRRMPHVIEVLLMQRLEERLKKLEPEARSTE
jgi:phosphoribosylglycinamide formyltransferase-1